MKPKISYPFLGNFPITFKFGAQPKWYIRIAGYPHNGVDFSMPIGTPILACDDGIIRYADNVPDADGLGINLSHVWGLSQYWHLSRLTVKYGQEVKRGDVIGLSGTTGWSTGPHTHFGTKEKESPVPGMRGWTNPINLLEKPPFQPQLPIIPTREYRVRLGDSLWKIAAKFYGKGYHWPRIYKANKNIIAHPSLIFPFQKLVIP